MAETIPRLRVPLEFSGTTFRSVEQDSDDDVAASVYALLATERDSRLEEANYGIEDPSFPQFPVDVDEWLEQIGIWEPRAQVASKQEIEDLIVNVVTEVGIR